MATERYTRVDIDRDPSSIGSAATTEDLERFAGNLSDALTEEFGHRVDVRLISTLRSAAVGDDAADVEARVHEIEQGDEWMQYLPRDTEIEEQSFRPTHVITDNDGAEIPVQCVDGACYTEHEWAHDDRADWELTDEDGLLFQGQAVAASYRTV